MKICKHCRQFLKLFENEFRFEVFDFVKKYGGKYSTLEYCKTQFIDHDNKLKSCLIIYHEHLSNLLDKPKEIKE